ncbi:myb/SANT-like DNA-binding domain-containing protein 4 [Cydia fagiglandana]|uniref:myb/SANT-like DNA-binding domain-containing protein 4 n=1 Tax=Cydia fagiglandana TaxID=1458189 RepID=UPI002FEE1ABB
MEEETQDDKPSASIFSRYRSPTFSRNEVQTLINIVERHKYTILNKSTNSAVNQAKELSWEKITKTFNSRGFKHERTTDSLKTKWENLKKDARKLAKNVVDDNNSYSDLTRQIVAMMSDVEANTPMEQSQNMEDSEEFIEPVSNDEKLSQNLKIKSYWESVEEKDSDDSHYGNDGEKRTNRSLNFAPQECSLLLECVRKEKRFVFSKEYNAHAIGLKNKAWKRISEAFNNKSPQKRSQKVLRTKFNNMKTVAKTMGIKDAVRNFDMNNTKHEKLINESAKPIKSEPMFEMELELNGPDDDDRHNSDSNHFAPDPLSTVLNSDSGIGSTHSSSWSRDNKEVANLKLKLLNYKMETARLERQRLEEAARASAATRESDSIAAALRLRAARLEAVAAAAKLPPQHPALLFTPEEQPAERYLRQYEHT